MMTEQQDVLKRSIADLIVMRDQLTGIESIDAERQKAQAKLDSVKRQLEAAKAEVKEALHYRDKYLAEARDSLAEKERLDKEIKDKSVQATQVNDFLNKVRQQLG